MGPTRGACTQSPESGLIKLGIRHRLRAFLVEIQRIKREELPCLEAMAKGRSYNKEWLDALEFENILELLEFATASALRRTESRGVHFRADYLDTDNDH